MNCAIEPITLEEFRTVLLQWAKDEGWRYSSRDVDTYFALNTTKIWALKLDDNIIGCVTITKYKLEKKDTLASVGLYLVKKEFRGQVLEGMKQTPGSLLWNQVSSKINKCALTCLNSISLPQLQSYYKKKGFYPTDKINLHLTSSSFFNSSITQKYPTGEADNCILFNNNFDKIIAYDNKLFTNSSNARKEFLNRWLERPDAIIAVYENHNEIEGYGVLTVCSENEGKSILRLSPAYADSIDVASKILYFLFQKATSTSATQIELNLPNANSPVLEILTEYGFMGSEESNTLLMITDADFELKSEILLKTMALTPLEFPHESILAAI